MLTKSSTELVRVQNRALVLAALRRQGPLAHTDIAAHTGLSSATVSAITHELEEEEALVRVERANTSGRGRPRVLFEQNRNACRAAIVRVSSDVIQVSLIDYQGRLLDRFDEPRTDVSAGADAFLDSLDAALHRLVGRSDLLPENIASISITSKGLVDTQRPVLLWTPIFGETRLDFGSHLARSWPSKITLNNETLLVARAILAKSETLNIPVTDRIAALSLGHSIGLGIAEFSSEGEDRAQSLNFGHMLHTENGALCRCGSLGCIEAHAGFYAILRNAFEVPLDTIPAKFVPITEIEKIAARARGGDRRAEYAFRQAGRALGDGLARMLSMFSQMPIALTGPGVRFFDLMQSGMITALGQSLVVRLEGMPDLHVLADEESLVFEGNLQKTLADIDRDVIAARTDYRRTP